MNTRKLITSALTTVFLSVALTQTVWADTSPQGRKIREYANPNALISVEQLRSLVARNDPNLVMIGTLDPTRALIPGNLAGSPIEGSFVVWRPDYSAAGSAEALSLEVSGFRRTREHMEELLSKAGATNRSTIVVYAADAHHDAARLYWQIKMLGHEDVRILDGGLNAWAAAGHPRGRTVRLADEARKTNYRAVRYEPALFDVSIAQVIEALKNPGEWVVIDTRSKDEFDGKRTGSSRGGFGTGRLRGAVHIDWIQAVNRDDTSFKTLSELRAIYGDTIRDKKVIVFCQSGVRSSHTYIVLKELLGAKEVYNYDGSWVEWSFAASEASGDRVGQALRSEVLRFTEAWNDNRGAI